MPDPRLCTFQASERAPEVSGLILCLQGNLSCWRGVGAPGTSRPHYPRAGRPAGPPASLPCAWLWLLSEHVCSSGGAPSPWQACATCPRDGGRGSGHRDNRALCLSAPETQDQVPRPVGWSHRPAGHHPHHCHLHPKVMPPTVSAPTALRYLSLHLPSRLSVHPSSSVSGLGLALATQQGTRRAGALFLEPTAEGEEAPTGGSPDSQEQSVLGGAAGRCQGLGRGAGPLVGGGGVERGCRAPAGPQALGRSPSRQEPDPEPAKYLQWPSGAAGCGAGVWVLQAVEQRDLKLSG